MSRVFRTSRPCGWVHPRPHQDASLRFHKHGPIRPMEYERRSVLRVIGELLRKDSRR